MQRRRLYETQGTCHLPSKSVSNKPPDLRSLAHHVHIFTMTSIICNIMHNLGNGSVLVNALNIITNYKYFQRFRVQTEIMIQKCLTMENVVD